MARNLVGSGLTLWQIVAAQGGAGTAAAHCGRDFPRSFSSWADGAVAGYMLGWVHAWLCCRLAFITSVCTLLVQGRRKIKKAGDAQPTPFEEQVAQELYNIEMQHSGLKADLYPLHITAAREIETGTGKNAVVMFVPYTQLSNYHKVQKSLVEELEKKFT